MTNITDLRDILPRHQWKTWKRRDLSQIAGVCFHQSLGKADLFAINKDHISPGNHVSATGCPRICYPLWIDRSGEVSLCNDLEDITWSQGGRARPFRGRLPNTNYVGVCFQGNFTGHDHSGTMNPTREQVLAGLGVWDWLKDMLHLTQMDLFGHYHFGKPACPGDELRGLVESMREEGLQELLPGSVEDWQLGLYVLGYELGSSGSDGNGIDGDWGQRSQKALVQFQTDAGLTVSLLRDTLTAQVMAWELLAKTNKSLPSYLNR